MSKLETNTIDTVSGTTNLTIGSTNSSTVTFENGAVTGHMYPAFEAYLSADQTGLSDNAEVKLSADTEVLDTDNCYDNSTNYRFTPTVAGKYYVYSSLKMQSNPGNIIAYMFNRIKKNGSVYRETAFDPDDNEATSLNLANTAIIDMNGTTDYIEIFGLVNVTGSGNEWRFDAQTKSSYFGAYRIGA